MFVLFEIWADKCWFHAFTPLPTIQLLLAVLLWANVTNYLPDNDAGNDSRLFFYTTLQYFHHSLFLFKGIPPSLVLRSYHPIILQSVCGHNSPLVVIIHLICMDILGTHNENYIVWQHLLPFTSNLMIKIFIIWLSLFRVKSLRGSIWGQTD